MIKLFCSGIAILLLLSGCGWDGTPTRNNDLVPLTSIEIVADSVSIAAHTSTKLAVKGNFSGLYTRDVTGQAVWTSDSVNVAEFAYPAIPNRVAGHAAGTAKLTASVQGISTAITLTVSPATITTMAITPANASIVNGLTRQFAVSGAFSDATTQDLTFDATWTSSATDVATISDDIGSKGLAKAVAAGTTTISATFAGVNDTTLLTVTEPELQSIVVTHANASILSLASEVFKATGNYTNGSTVDITKQVAWSSSNTNIATIAASGVATTLLQGTTSISATLNNVSGAAILKVTGGNLVSIRLPSNLSLVKGTTARMSATGVFSNGASRDITGVVEWSTSNTNNATVTVPGGNLAWLNALLATPVSTPAIITARSGTVTATTNLTVTDLPVQSIALSPPIMDLAVGTGNRFILTAAFNNGTTQDVTASSEWSSSSATALAGNSGVSKGKVSGVASGSSSISASYGGFTVSAPVTVTAPTINDLIITGTTKVVSGNQVAFMATASYTNGASRDVTEETVWTIDKSNVARLADSQNLPGQVVAFDSGTAVLTATFSGKTRTFTITVP